MGEKRRPAHRAVVKILAKGAWLAGVGVITMQRSFNPVRLDAVKWRLHLSREGTPEQIRRLVYGLLQGDPAADEAHKNKKRPPFSLRAVNHKWAEVCTWARELSWR